MIDIESKIISCREDTNDYRLCLTREEIDEIKNIRVEAYNKALDDVYDELGMELVWVLAEFGSEAYMDIANSIRNVQDRLSNAEQLKEQR